MSNYKNSLIIMYVNFEYMFTLFMDKNCYTTEIIIAEIIILHY